MTINLNNTSKYHLSEIKFKNNTYFAKTRKIKNNIEITQLFEMKQVLGFGSKGIVYSLENKVGCKKALKVALAPSFIPLIASLPLDEEDENFLKTTCQHAAEEINCENLQKGQKVLDKQLVNLKTGQPVKHQIGLMKRYKPLSTDSVLLTRYDGSLDSLVPTTFQQVDDLFRQLLQGLAHLHKNTPYKPRCILGDIKLDNIFFKNRQTEFVLGDIDEAINPDDPTLENYRSLTPQYVNFFDQQALTKIRHNKKENVKILKKADIYALGLSLCWFLTNCDLEETLKQKNEQQCLIHRDRFTHPFYQSKLNYYFESKIELVIYQPLMQKATEEQRVLLTKIFFIVISMVDQNYQNRPSAKKALDLYLKDINNERS